MSSASSSSKWASTEQARAPRAGAAAESALLVRRDDPDIAATVARWMASDADDQRVLFDPAFDAVGVALHDAGNDELAVTLIFAGR